MSKCGGATGVSAARRRRRCTSTRRTATFPGISPWCDSGAVSPVPGEFRAHATPATLHGVRVATFNVKHGRQRMGSVDLDLLTRTCAALEADVLALQEVDVRRYRTRFADQPGKIAAGTGMVSAFGAASKTLFGGYGNALLVRGSIDEQTLVHVPQRSREPRVCLFARARVGDGRPFSVAVTHLST